MSNYNTPEPNLNIPLGQPLDTGYANSVTSMGGTAGKIYHSYSGCDIKAVCFNAATGTFDVLANIQTISYSIHREKFPVRSLGNTHVKQYTAGPRTIAGSIIFTVFDTSVLGSFLGLGPKEMEAQMWKPVTVDQIPPFNIVLLFASEYNVLSSMNLYNVQIVNEGQVMSIEDIITENTCQYVATHISPIKPVSQQTSQGTALIANNFAQLMSQPIYNELFRARNPFDFEMSGAAANTLQQLQKMAGIK
jgi:hypothetical protein